MKASFGQNFLINEKIAEKITDSAGLSPDDNVFEIGPGKGILTKYLAEKAGMILALEVDRNLAKGLREKNLKKTKIIESDILKTNLPDLIKGNNFDNYKLVANIPYYITSKIIRLFLETKYPPSEMVLMVQKEVGERIIAKDGKESLLSISVKFYANPELLFEVSRENFEPAPEVDSIVLRIKRRNDVPSVNIKRFFSLVRSGFSAKRKTLANNLSASLHISKNKVLEILRKAGLNSAIRAEKIKVDDWVRLYEAFCRPK